MGNVLNCFIIQPLIMVYDVLYSILYSIIKDPVLAILALSIVVNFLALPLYKKADQLQREEMEKAKKMKPWLTHIRKHFSGDERFMMQSAYYTIEHYNPLSILKEAGPLFLQTPIFIAAYRYISAIPLLEKASFGPITNLLAPDGLLTVGGLTINILPIIMTLINCTSGFIYSRGGPIRQKIQIYGIAAIFLGILYDSPSGLVIYWIMNQIFSLCKNIVFTRGMKETVKEVIIIICSVILLFLSENGIIKGDVSTDLQLFVVTCVAIVCIFKIVSGIVHLKKDVFQGKLFSAEQLLSSGKTAVPFSQLLAVEVSLAVLMGLYIPSSVLSSAPIDFIDSSTGQFPYELLTYPALVYGGLFVLWMSVIIFSRDGAKRRNLALMMWVFLGVGLVNQFFFDPHVGILYANLRFDQLIDAGLLRSVLNVLICLIIAAVFIAVYAKNPQWMKSFCVIVSIALVVLSGINVNHIQKAVSDYSLPEKTDTRSNRLTLSKNGTNVIVFMLDRAVGGYVPYIFDEIPELKDKFQGFVYYEDTLSFGLCTNYGTPALFGGYEYTPAEMNKRDDELLRDKHNEALKLMPALFSGNGYQTIVCDPPLANYKSPADLSIFDEYPNVKAYNLQGVFSAAFQAGEMNGAEIDQRRSFIMFSLFRTVPLPMKTLVYDRGSYISLKTAMGSYSQDFLDYYSELVSLPSITYAKDDEENYFLMMQNATPHEPVALNPPEYAVDGESVSYEYANKYYNGRTLKIESSSQWGAYCVNVATYKVIAEWLDFLREQGVYDNTRIIFVADHGNKIGQFDDLCRSYELDVESFWPLLMVKDFHSQEPFTTSMEFMTQADVPTLAMEGIIDEPINPFTGKAVNSEAKNGLLLVTDSWKWNTKENNGTTFNTTGDRWWTVHDSIFDLDNWELIR